MAESIVEPTDVPLSARNCEDSAAKIVLIQSTNNMASKQEQVMGTSNLSERREKGKPRKRRASGELVFSDVTQSRRGTRKKELALW